ncbi:hypothetical protein SAMN05192533_12061 [Mesobacillus persicus]|uniref:Uncharacterized protein n=1 Tax=Mesobacillus persicus TaxID=930146 RepID=A0A1H8JB82_9BACI|nr:hypothetical protein SAMN05192533_12061 [Mesobacillus persicus]
MTKHYCKQCMGFTKETQKCDQCGHDEVVEIEINTHK